MALNPPRKLQALPQNAQSLGLRDARILGFDSGKSDFARRVKQLAAEKKLPLGRLIARSAHFLNPELIFHEFAHPMDRRRE
jgi:hypothetical protein